MGRDRERAGLSRCAGYFKAGVHYTSNLNIKTFREVHADGRTSTHRASRDALCSASFPSHRSPPGWEGNVNSWER